MKFRSPKKGRGLIINITSLIDVMFLLLIFFMVTSTFRNQPAINLVLPRSSTAIETADTPLIVYMTSEGSVFLNDQLVLEDELSRRLEERHAATGEDRLVLRADEDATHGNVVHLMDVIRQSGFTRLGFSARAEGSQ